MTGQPPRSRRRIAPGICVVFLALGAGPLNSAQRQTNQASGPPSPPSQLSCPCSLLPLKAVPVTTDAGPDNPVELGVQFTSDVPGVITGIRFYKSQRNTGVHVGSLWTNTGTLLSRVTFTGETESGWQLATFAAPVPVSPHTTYVASYHTHAGHYAYTKGYFATRLKSDGPLHPLRGADTPNGVYLYGSGGFPQASLNSANYWVDVIFVPADDSAPTPASVAPASVAMRIVDSTTADLSGGTSAETVVTQTDDGEVILAPAAGSEFADGATPTGWRQDPWSGTGATQFRNGVAQIDGANLAVEATFTPGRSVEFEAVFTGTPNQHAGFGITFAGGPWAIFSSFNGDGLYARTTDGSRRVDTRVTGEWFGKPHRFRIDWNAKSIAYWVDGTLVVTHPVSLGRKMRILASDLMPDGAALTLGWIHLTPYVARGSFTSRVFDGGRAINWSAVAWEGDEPAGSRVTLSVRSGDTPVPDASWTSFTALPNSTGTFATSRYIQYQLVLETTAPTTSPVVRQVTLTGSPVTF
jgi:hypothetical protein